MIFRIFLGFDVSLVGFVILVIFLYFLLFWFFLVFRGVLCFFEGFVGLDGFREAFAVSRVF